MSRDGVFAFRFGLLYSDLAITLQASREGGEVGVKGVRRVSPPAASGVVQQREGSCTLCVRLPLSTTPHLVST